MKKLAIIACMAILMSSCYTTRIAAPVHKDVKLAAETDVLNYKVKKKNWYLLWGGVKLTNDKVARTIKEHDLGKVRVTTKMDFLDIVINATLGYWLSITTNTSVIEGDASK